ncbi:Cof-type HAD-IIB family hydrolase [Tumebacillus flagellatus]|uniref:Cof-type HAD-IIB family hydrolase n=1 Tax=Tumebacillus flagellatus TaxID=1157490 RepID=UPI00056FADA0|nr:Cof-type HAD-IIB family hydrolase [Tumebacillus flagellatus]
MTKKLIALDLDGTLLNREKQISPRTKRAVQRAVVEGHHVCIATGRPFRSSVQYYRELGLTTPMVNFNGALVHHADDTTWGTHHFPMERETAFRILQVCEQFQAENVIVEVKDDYYLKQHDDNLIRFMGDGHSPLGIGNIPDLLTDHPTSVLIYPQKETVHELREHLSQFHADVIEHRLWGAPWHVIEIVKAGVNKATGLQVIADSLGIEREHIIAFGDEDNDLEMIEYAGYGVAMGNANPMLKNVANHITDTNDNDGIAFVLEKLL